MLGDCFVAPPAFPPGAPRNDGMGDQFALRNDGRETSLFLAMTGTGDQFDPRNDGMGDQFALRNDGRETSLFLAMTGTGDQFDPCDDGDGRLVCSSQ